MRYPRHRSLGLFSLVTLFALSATQVHAQTTYYVNGSCGDDAWTGTSSNCAAPDGPKATIQAAIDAAASGDTVLVADGVYTGNPVFEIVAGKDITLRSAGGPGNCHLEGATLNDAVGLIRNGVSAQSSVTGFTIAKSRSGIHIDGDASISDCVFKGSIVNSALGINDSNPNTPIASPVISDCQFEAISRPGTHDWGTVNITVSNPVFEDCVFTGGKTPGFSGRAVSVQVSSNARFLRCSFVGNHALRGSAIYCRTSSLTIDECVFENNSADDWGGGGYGLKMERTS